MSDLDSSATGDAQPVSELVRRIRDGDRAAGDALFSRYRPGLVFMLRRHTGDPHRAEDLAQEALTLAYEKLRGLRGKELEEPEKIAGWLHGTAKKLASGEWKKESRRRTTADSDAVAEAADATSNPADIVESQQVGHAVRMLIEELETPRDRYILREYYVNDVDKDVICDELGIDALHFNRVIYRAKQRFRKLLEKEARKGTFRVVDQ